LNPGFEMTEHYDAVIVGTGFAGAFFLMRYLEHARAGARVLVLERGGADTKSWQLQNRRTSSIETGALFVNRNPEKEWLTSPGFGGNSKCWWAGATRFMPGDFQLKSRYGVGIDWPVSYEDLEKHYGVVEEVMAVSGPVDSPMPRSRPFPLPPHIFSDSDAALKKRFPEGWYHPATARASRPTPTRAACCASGLCELCPIDAKFTIQNGLSHIYRDSRVTLELESAVEQVETEGGTARGVVYSRGQRSARASADLVVLAASALFNPHILLRSGFDHPLLGKRLHEQLPIDVCLDLRGMKGYNGSTSISGNGYLFYEGEHRRHYAGCMIENWNSPFAYGRASLRSERGRWNERMYVRFLFDELPREDNAVTVHVADPRLAEARFSGYSDYALRGKEQIPKMIDELAQALPIERVESMATGRTSAHIQGTAVMGQDPSSSIVDRHLIHHQVRNLLVLGASAFPTASPAYPTLTISALSLWSADHLFRAGA
jgi:choline dehydrogenase-like flavoprotein